MPNTEPDQTEESETKTYNEIPEYRDLREGKRE